MKKYIDYAKHLNAENKVISWINSNLKNYLNKYDGKNGTKNLENQTEIEHIIDYLVSDECPKRIERMSYADAKSNTDKWNKALIKKGSEIIETSEDTKIIKKFRDGFKIVKLIGKNAFEREGFLMRHCVGSYFDKNAEVYSLRDKDNMPHCTMEKDKQIKGKGNGSISPKYIKYIVSFLEEIGMTVGDNEMKNLGYLNIQKIKKYLHEDTKFFNNEYVFEEDTLIGKDGKEFLSLELLDIKPLIKDTESSLKINFDIPKLIDSSFEFMEINASVLSDKNISNEKHISLTSFKYGSKLATAGYDSKLASAGSYSHLASSGENSKLATSGYGSKLATTGNDSKLMVSGNYSRLASAGNNSQLVSSGNESQLVSAGYGLQLASFGDYSRLATTGYKSKILSFGKETQLATTGNDSQLKSSGDCSHSVSAGEKSKLESSGEKSYLASTGYKSQLITDGDDSRMVSSGNYSQLTINGNNSVGVSIGINSKIRGVEGSWIALAEYDNDVIINFKTAQIDGIILKENVFYKLVNGEFTEA